METLIGIVILAAIGYFVMKGVAKQQAIQQNIERHQAAYDLLRFHAFSDDKLNRSEVDIIASYMQTIPGYAYDAVAFKKQLSVGVPGLASVPSHIMTVQERLSGPEIDVLVSHLEMLRGTKKRHAPAVAKWYEDTLRDLRPTPAPTPGVKDLRLA